MSGGSLAIAIIGSRALGDSDQAVTFSTGDAIKMLGDALLPLRLQ